MIWHSSSVDEILKKLGTSKDTGLFNDQISTGTKKYGKNTLSKHKKQNFFLKFLYQFKNVTTVFLMIAALLSLVIGLYTAKRSPARKLLWGLIACGALFLSLLIGNLLFFGIRFYNVPTIAAGVIVGGVCGVILGKRKVRKFA